MTFFSRVRSAGKSVLAKLAAATLIAKSAIAGPSVEQRLEDAAKAIPEPINAGIPLGLTKDQKDLLANTYAVTQANRAVRRAVQHNKPSRLSGPWGTFFTLYPMAREAVRKGRA